MWTWPACLTLPAFLRLPDFAGNARDCTDVVSQNENQRLYADRPVSTAITQSRADTIA